MKVALLEDPALFAELCATASRIRQRDLTAALPAIRASAERHRRRYHLGGGDPFESRGARPLDFGHWSAHRLEAMTDFQVRHGEAVAIGAALDTVYSSLALGLPSDVADRVLRCLTDLGLPLGHPALRQGEALFEDSKSSGSIWEGGSP